MFTFPKFSVSNEKKILLIIMLSAMVILAAACNKKADPAPAAASGRQISRIISAAPSNTEIIAGLGLAGNLIAVDKYSNGIPGVPHNAAEIDFFFPDIEAVIGLEPDIIIANEINMYGVSDNPFKLLGDLGIRVIDIPASTSIEGICNDIMTIAHLLNVEQNGIALAESLRRDVDAITAKSTQGKSVYFEISPAPFMYSFGQGTFLNEMIEITGGKNIFADQTSWFAPSAEEIINRNPEIIFTMAYPGEDPVTEILSRSEFQSITAVKENRVYAIDADSASRASQNIILALRQMSAAVNSAP